MSVFTKSEERMELYYYAAGIVITGYWRFYWQILIFILKIYWQK